MGLVSVLGVMVLMLVLVSPDAEAFWQCFKKMFGLMPPQMEGLGGIWGLGWAPVYRYPILTAFVAMCGSFAIWPAQKNLGTLLSCSAAVMVATQFWHGYGGGLYMAWYLPLFLLTVFRPNLEDRVATSVVGRRLAAGQVTGRGGVTGSRRTSTEAAVSAKVLLVLQKTPLLPGTLVEAKPGGRRQLTQRRQDIEVLDLHHRHLIGFTISLGACAEDMVSHQRIDERIDGRLLAESAEGQTCPIHTIVVFMFQRFEKRAAGRAGCRFPPGNPGTRGSPPDRCPATRRPQAGRMPRVS